MRFVRYPDRRVVIPQGGWVDSGYPQSFHLAFIIRPVTYIYRSCHKRISVKSMKWDGDSWKFLNFPYACSCILIGQLLSCAYLVPFYLCMFLQNVWVHVFLTYAHLTVLQITFYSLLCHFCNVIHSFCICTSVHMYIWSLLLSATASPRRGSKTFSLSTTPRGTPGLPQMW